MPEQSSVFARTVFYAVTIRKLGVSRKVSVDSVECETDKALLRVSKRILECDEYSAITNVGTLIKDFLKTQTIPGAKFLKPGIYPIPLALVERVDARMEKFLAKYQDAVNAFCAVYESKRDECLKRLESIGDPADYPPLSKVANAFGVETRYISIGAPDSLASVSRDLYEKELAKVNGQFAEAVDEVKMAMRQMTMGFVSHFAECSKPGPDGKQRRLHEGKLEAFKDFISTFDDRNITNDVELATAVAKCRKILEGVDIEALRTKDMRKQVGIAMEGIKADVSAMVEAMPSRAMMLDD